MFSKAQIKRQIKKIKSPFLRKKLKNRNFTLISNNCWGGTVYDNYSLPYSTPTIGLWIPPKDYLKFLKNMKYYLNEELVNINYKDCHICDLLEKRKASGRYTFDLNDMIIGRIVDIDIIFIHYNSFDDAKSKWDRRKKRINYNNIVVKMNDQNECDENDVNQFLSLDYKNKLFFTANKEWVNKDRNIIYTPKYENDGYVVSDTEKGDVPINMTEYLNNIML